MYLVETFGVYDTAVLALIVALFGVGISVTRIAYRQRTIPDAGPAKIKG